VNPFDIARSLEILRIIPLGFGLLVRARFPVTATRLRPAFTRISTASYVIGYLSIWRGPGVLVVAKQNLTDPDVLVINHSPEHRSANVVFPDSTGHYLGAATHHRWTCSY
jgi:hypothetical protein